MKPYITGVTVQWNESAKRGLNKLPGVILYKVARQTLDLSIPTIPKDSGTMRTSSMSAGVRGTPSDYYIGSYTSYASSVWKMTNVNWTTPGTNNQWFLRTLQKNKDVILQNAINQGWRDVM